MMILHHILFVEEKYKIKHEHTSQDQICLNIHNLNFIPKPGLQINYKYISVTDLTFNFLHIISNSNCHS